MANTFSGKSGHDRRTWRNLEGNDVNYYIGWDVGAWHCDGGKSRDTLCALQGHSLRNLAPAGTVWRGNLRQALVGMNSVLAAILKEIGVKPDEAHSVTWAIDTPLGWPKAFRDLIGSNGNTVDIPNKAAGNLYLFRQTEFWLFGQGFRPLSTVMDRIGSQSTKGVHFLHRFGFSHQSAGVWRADGQTAIETYPAPVARSKHLQRAFKRLQVPLLQQPAATGDDARKDVKDSLWCALIAATFGLDRKSLREPDQNVPSGEGWIWIPKDCRAPKGA